MISNLTMCMRLTSHFIIHSSRNLKSSTSGNSSFRGPNVCSASNREPVRIGSNISLSPSFCKIASSPSNSNPHGIRIVWLQPIRSSFTCLSLVIDTTKHQTRILAINLSNKIFRDLTQPLWFANRIKAAIPKESDHLPVNTNLKIPNIG